MGTVTAAVTRASLVDAAADLNRVLDLDPPIDVKQGVSKLREKVVEARELVRETDPIAQVTREVLSALNGADEGPAAKNIAAPEKKDKTPNKTPAAKSTKPVALGKFEPVRRGESAFAKVLEPYLAGGAATIAGAASYVGGDKSKAISALRRARIVHGIDHSIAEDGSLTIVLPKGVDAESVWAKPREKTTKVAKVPTAPKAQPKPGDFKPVRHGSRMHKFLVQASDGKTLGEIAKASDRVDFTEKDVKWWLVQYLRRHHGIAAVVNEDKTVTLTPPAGKNLADCVSAPAG